ncbi:MAG: sugar-binding domain-containing protein, partial [bacterium]
MERFFLFSLSILLLTFIAYGEEEIYLKENKNELIFSNAKLSLHFSRENGFLMSIFYKPSNIQILTNSEHRPPLDIKVEGEWLEEKLALKEVIKGRGISLEGKWKFSIDPEDKGLAEGWQLASCDDRKWNELNIPGMWEDFGYTQIYPNSPSPEWKPYNGYAFVRRNVILPSEWEGKDLLLYIGAIDDFDWVYFNGQLIGHTGEETPNWWEKHRVYVIPRELVKWGKENLLAIRIYDRGGEGGIRGPIFIVKKEDWEELRCPIKLVDYKIEDEGKRKKLEIRSRVGDWIIESEYILYPQSDLIMREGRVIYEGKENPHISDLRFSLSEIRLGEKGDFWFMIPSNFPPRRYKFEGEERTINDDYAWSSNRCVIV